MYRWKTGIAAAAALHVMSPLAGAAQSHEHPQLHVNPRWEECAFQLDATLTQGAWRQFTKEAALVTYLRPLRDARAMGAGRFEISLVQSTVAIDDHDSAWNDTFVHPDSTHWLYEGDGLPVPGIVGRAGVTDRIDVGAYFTKNPNSNYGFAGGQVQYNFLQDATSPLDASARVSAVTLFGPEDLDFAVYGVDLVASKQYPVFGGAAAISPYAGVSGFLASAHEKSAAVTLDDERQLGIHAMLGASAQISVVRLAIEYDAGRVGSTSMKIGFGF